MSVKIKILIGILILITLSSLIYAQISRSETVKYQAAAMLAQQEATNQYRAAEAIKANAKEAISEIERLAENLMKVRKQFEKCKNGEEFKNPELDL